MDSVPQKPTRKGYSLNLTPEQREHRSRLNTERLLRLSQKANEAYDAHPNLCLQCHQPIPRREGVRLNEIKAKKFCNQSCAATYNNAGQHFPPKRKKIGRCTICGTPINTARRVYCPSCLAERNARLSNKTKAEVARNDITSHARGVLNGIRKVCAHCGWDHFVEVAHVKPVGSFPPTALVKEINAPSNLMYLCPNCHWDYDHPRGAPDGS